MVSDKGAAIWCSDKVMRACSKTLCQLMQGALPWVLTGLTMFGEVAGVAGCWRNQQHLPLHQRRRRLLKIKATANRIQSN